MNKSPWAIAAVLALFAGTASAAAVYNWKEGGTTKYSDTPRGLKIGKSNVMNVRTQTVIPQSAARPTMPESLADRQAQLSQEIAMRNRQVEEQNAKALEHNQKIEQCNNARSSRRLAEGARNREQLIQKYDEEIARHCNG
ncbi:DUF4124 domain-containing protein [Conchiformibius kuhniae]|nr:DUF4124 domain-containing protein [Conchiformibius kuhniae]UOP04218.1 DUF4124 domain-containing protein [Conchiformibius kuhniae]